MYHFIKALQSRVMHIMLLPELVLAFFFGELHISFSYCTSASFHKPRGYSCDVCAKEKHCGIIIYKHFSHVDGEASQDFRLARLPRVTTGHALDLHDYGPNQVIN
jgi:hypothetical protein